MKKIELLNSEGPILIAQKLGDRFMLEFREENYQIEVDRHELLMFIEGTRDIFTPEGKRFNYREFSDSMKPDRSDLFLFIDSEINPTIKF
jgi:hypothetical protein